MNNVESIIKWQLIISTILMTLAVFPLISFLPENFIVNGVAATRYSAFGCVAFGLWAGLIIGYITEVFTSNTYSPV